MQDTTHNRTHLVLERSGHVTARTKFVPASREPDMSKSVAVGCTTVAAAEVKRDIVSHDARRLSPTLLSTVDSLNRPIDPMLLVHEERMKTLRLLARLIGRAVRAIVAR